MAPRKDTEKGRRIARSGTKKIRGTDDDKATDPEIPQIDPRIGTRLVGRYDIERLIGRGGMGRVYRAQQLMLNRPVAVKFLNPEFQRKDRQFVQRFFLEAASAARLGHPNTITVFEYGETDAGELFIVMEYLEGRPLSWVIRDEGPFLAERTVQISVQICRALREAHSKGIIHRDLKPGNILIERRDDADFVKVLDFGLVKLFTPKGEGQGNEVFQPGGAFAQDLTRAGMFLGSPKFMSPEQIQHRSLDPRTDIYSLGILMYHMTVGSPPFMGSSGVEVIFQHINEPVPSMASRGVKDVPEQLEALIRKCLAKAREDRFSSMGELLDEFKHVAVQLVSVSSSIDSLLSSGDLARLSELPGRGESAADQKNMPAPTVRTLSSLGTQTKRSIAAQLPMAALIIFSALVVGLGFIGYMISGGSTGTVVPVDVKPSLAPVKKAKTRILLGSEPSGVQVFEDDQPLGVTPMNFERDRSDKAHIFRFRARGYEDVVRRVRFDRETIRLQVALPPKPPSPKADSKADPGYKDNPY